MKCECGNMKSRLREILSTIILLLIAFSGKSQELDCASYQTGKFYVSEDSDAIITRTRKIQKEKSKHVNLKDKIVWISDCKYKLIPIKIKDKKNRVTDLILFFEIIETGKDYYVVRVTNEINDFVLEAKMIRIN